MPKSRPNPIALWAAMVVIYVVWGSTYFGIAIAIETIPPLLMSAVRFLIAGVVLLLWDRLRDPGPRHRPTVRELRDSAIVGILLLGVGNGFVALGELTVPSGIAAILVAMIPVWFAVLGWVYFRDRLPRVVGLAVAIGFGGVALLAWPTGGASALDPLGLVILILAPLGWAHGSLFAARRARLPSRPLTASGLQMLAGAAFLVVEAAIIGEPARFRPEAFSAASLIALAYLTIFGSMVAFTVYGWLLRHAPLSLVGTYAYVNPVVAVALGTAFLGEAFGVREVVASAVILLSVVMTVTARGRLAEALPVPEAPAAGPTAASARVSALSPSPAASGPAGQRGHGR